MSTTVYGDISINYVDSLSIYTVLVATHRHYIVHGCVSVTHGSVTIARPTFNGKQFAASWPSTHCATRSLVVHGCISIVAVGIDCYTWDGS